MCIVVDANSFASVFNPADSEHIHFKPVFSHIDNNKSKLIIGGTQFRKEIVLMKKYIKIISEMRKAGKVVFENDQKVDELEAILEKQFKDPLFNDKHVVALVYTSNARMVCTKDKVLQQYLKRNEFYSKNKTKPLIFNEASRPSAVPQRSFKPLCKLC